MTLGTTAAQAQLGFIGDDVPVSLSVCEEATDDVGVPRDECQAADVRLQLPAGAPPDAEFGFTLAMGFVNGDAFEDLLVGDPSRGRVYVFLGRGSVAKGYELDPSDLADREVDADARADAILEVPGGSPTLIDGLGFSLAVGEPQDVGSGCAPNDRAAPVLIGAPGAPGTTGNAPGRAIYVPAGQLCITAQDMPSPTTLDPLGIGQVISGNIVENDDEFGYSVAFGRVSDAATADDEDVIVGARGAAAGAGRVTVFPVASGVVTTGASVVIEIEGEAGDGLGEVLATGDLDSDEDPIDQPFGDTDDLAIGGVGSDNGKVVLVQGPLAADGGSLADGTYRADDDELSVLIGEGSGDFFGFSVAISTTGSLAVGAPFADNVPPGANGGSPESNVAGLTRINAGKAYLWTAPAIDPVFPERSAITASRVLIARRSGDQLGFAVAFGDVDGIGPEDAIVTARREDGSGLVVDQIDQGTAYVESNFTSLNSPVDLNLCGATSDCTGVAGIDVMLFGGDREADAGDEMGYAVATGDANGDGVDDVYLSSLVNRRVYLATLVDTDGDRSTQGRNIRDDDDDEDGDLDDVDCGPLDPDIFSTADEVTCNGVDENCNGMDDDAPDADGDSFDLCGGAGAQADCDDDDPFSFPGATEVCDGNDNACNGAPPPEERDRDDDGYVTCTGFDDIQGEDPSILGGDDCAPFEAGIFPGAAENESSPGECRADVDEDGYGDPSPPSGVTPGTDCDDADGNTFPGAAEIEDSVSCMQDSDDDGYGDSSPPGGVVAGTDCNDDDTFSFPGAVERCDGNDNACSGTVPADELDLDVDGYVTCAAWNDVQNDNATVIGGGDCSDADGDAFPGASPNETFAGACTKDSDGDDYGDISPPAGIVAGTDCDDGSIVTFPGAAAIDGPLNCMKDADDDDYGDDSVSLPVVAGNDCADEDPAAFPSAAETPDDGIDQDCNGFDTVTCFVDQDRDGFGSTETLLADDGDCDDSGESNFDTDCDDDDPLLGPGEPEIADDGIDQDCNGFDTVTCFVDADEDGFGTASLPTVLADDGSCDAVQQESATSDDCDDADNVTYPGAPEQCDGNINACTGVLDPAETDLDGDGYVGCVDWNDPQGDDPTVLGGGDCDDTDTQTFPGAAPGESIPTACMTDADGDDYGDLSPAAGVTAGSDCDDSSALTFPGAAEIEAPLNCMRDADDDGYGDATALLPVVAGGDCADDDPNTFPGAAEACDGNDTSCAGVVAPGEIDQDGDGYVACSGWNDVQGDDPTVLGGDDCDEADVLSFPGAAPNESVPDACMRDADGDDYGDRLPPPGVTAGSDCDDASAVTFPGAAEIEAPLNCMRDADDDGYGDSAAVLPIVPGTDCDDAMNTVFPSAPETCGDGIDQDCDGFDLSCASGQAPRRVPNLNFGLVPWRDQAGTETGAGTGPATGSTRESASAPPRRPIRESDSSATPGASSSGDGTLDGGRPSSSLTPGRAEETRNPRERAPSGDGVSDSRPRSGDGPQRASRSSTVNAARFLPGLTEIRAAIAIAERVRAREESRDDESEPGASQ